MVLPESIVRLVATLEFLLHLDYGSRQIHRLERGESSCSTFFAKLLELLWPSERTLQLAIQRGPTRLVQQHLRAWAGRPLQCGARRPIPSRRDRSISQLGVSYALKMPPALCPLFGECGPGPTASRPTAPQLGERLQPWTGGLRLRHTDGGGPGRSPPTRPPVSSSYASNQRSRSCSASQCISSRRLSALGEALEIALGIDLDLIEQGDIAPAP